MKQHFIILTAALLVLTGCKKQDFGLAETDLRSVEANFESRFGISIDANQDWNSIISGSVTITADADLNDIVKVQILNESPFRNADARVLNEAKIQKGETVTLTYDAPKLNKRLIAACVDSKGRYYIKGFDMTSNEVSFQSATRSVRRAATTYPEASTLKMEFKNSEASYNALRTWVANMAVARGDEGFTRWTSEKHIDLWADKGWEAERLWKPSDTSTGTEWKVVNGTVVRDIAAITAEENESLQDIFNQNLYRTDPSGKWGRKDNLPLIRESEVVKFYNNHLVSDGVTPITVIPVQMSSSEMKNCHLYYYYYKTSDIPTGMSETDYIKQLPKFKAIQCWHTMSAAGIGGNGSESFFKKHEYLLPYYGAMSVYANQSVPAEEGFSTDGKAYRIRNGAQLNGTDYFMTFLPMNQSDKIATRYADDDANVADQLWKVYTDKDGNTALYNIGAGRFLVWDGAWDTRYSPELDIVNANRYWIDSENHIWRYNNRNKQGLGTDLGSNYGIWTDKNTGIGDKLKWYFEEYTGNAGIVPAAVNFEKHVAQNTAPSIVIPEGYRIGFVLRKLQGSQNWAKDDIITSPYNGCCYSAGSLNKEIFHFPGHFVSSGTYFSMQEDDPRVAYFTGNGRTYLTFEDGSDAQYSDMIIEITGTKELHEDIDPEAAAYTMCFEDRPHEADYDLNDVVLRCSRVDATTIELALVAAGANDEVVIRGAEGWELNNREVHEIFHATTTAADGNRFVNTVIGGTRREVQSRYVTIDATMTIPEYLKNIYIENYTTGRTIRYSKTGEPPFAIIVPEDFQYPKENLSITEAYKEFLEWAQDVNASGDWYKYDEADKIFPSLFQNW